MLWLCFAAGGTGALHKIDDIMRKENYVDVLKQHLKTSVRKLKLDRKWVFQMDNELWINGLSNENKVKILEWPSESPDLNPVEN